jgi:hypothetical protein
MRVWAGFILMCEICLCSCVTYVMWHILCFVFLVVSFFSSLHDIGEGWLVLNFESQSYRCNIYLSIYPCTPGDFVSKHCSRQAQVPSLNLLQYPCTQETLSAQHCSCNNTTLQLFQHNTVLVTTTASSVRRHHRDETVLAASIPSCRSAHLLDVGQGPFVLLKERGV